MPNQMAWLQHYAEAIERTGAYDLYLNKVDRSRQNLNSKVNRRLHGGPSG